MKAGAGLHARPSERAAVTARGLQPLRFGSSRDSYYYVSRHCKPGRSAPAVLLLQSAGGHAYHGLEILRPLADEYGLILVEPVSSHQTWDVIAVSEFGADVVLSDQCLEQAFSQYAGGQSHLAIGGFSDGASV